MPTSGCDVHQLRQRHQRLAGHDAVGVQHDHVVVGAAPVAHELGDVAGLAADVLGAAAIEDAARRAAPRLDQRAPGGSLRRGDLGLARVGEHEEIEALRLRRGCCCSDYQMASTPANTRARVLVVDRHDDGGAALQGVRRRALADAARPDRGPISRTTKPAIAVQNAPEIQVNSTTNISSARPPAARSGRWPAGCRASGTRPTSAVRNVRPKNSARRHSAWWRSHALAARARHGVHGVHR